MTFFNGKTLLRKHAVCISNLAVDREATLTLPRVHKCSSLIAEVGDMWDLSRRIYILIFGILINYKYKQKSYFL